MTHDDKRTLQDILHEWVQKTGHKGSNIKIKINRFGDIISAKNEREIK